MQSGYDETEVRLKDEKILSYYAIFKNGWPNDLWSKFKFPAFLL